MNWINRLPIWAWFLITLALCYAMWNPSNSSLWHFWTEGDAHLSLKVLVGAMMLGVVIMYAHETWMSLGVIGLAIFMTIIGASIWMMHDFGWLRGDNLYTAKYWAQIPIALLLTIGFQGGRMYRSLTGRVPVTVGDHHGAQADYQQHHDVPQDATHH